MTDDGYTLVEMLAALAILGLAMGGFAGAAEAFRNLQLAAARPMAQTAALARAQRDLERVLSGAGPFLSLGPGSLRGSATSLDFACGQETCTAALQDDGADAFLHVEAGGWTDQARLSGAAGAKFSYADASGASPTWPPSSAQRPSRALRSVSILAGSPVAVARLWLTEPAGCEFDGITRTCRSASP